MYCFMAEFVSVVLHSLQLCNYTTSLVLSVSVVTFVHSTVSEREMVTLTSLICPGW